jgi:hypothetical protein
MTRFVRSRWCRFTALLLSLAVLHSAPGLASYAALAQTVKAPVSGASSIPTVRVGAPLGSAALMPSGSAALTAPRLAGSLNMAPAPRLSAPSIAPGIAADAAASTLQTPLAPVAGPRGTITTIPTAALPAVSGLSAAAESPRWVESAIPAAAQIQEAAAALQAVAPAANDAPAASPLSAAPILNRVFDASRSHAELDAPVAGGLSGFAPLSAAADGPGGPTGIAPASPSSPNGPNGPSNDGPRRLPVTVGLLLAIGGGVGAWYAAPVLVPLLTFALGKIPFVTVPALPLLAYKSIVTALGAAAGLSAFSVRTWLGFPADLKATSLAAGRTTFRFWARFGMIFDAVLRGKSTDEAQNAPLPAGIHKYPVIAMPFVLLGYIATPIAFVIGAGWRLVGTPLLAAWRGAHDVAVGFFPWLAKVFRFLGDVFRNIIPFIGGLLWGALRGVFFAAAAGAIVASAPVFRDVVLAEYEPKSVPGWVSYRLLQLGGLIATLGVGLAGAAAGLLVSPAHTVLSMLRMAFKWSDASPSADRFFSRFERALSEDKAFNALMERGSKSERAETLASRGSRLVNGTLSGLALLAVYPFLALATFVRGLYTAARGVEIERWDTDFERNRPAKGAERETVPNAGFLAPAILGGLGLAGGVLAYAWYAPAVLVFGGLAGLGMWAAAGLAGMFLGLALSQPATLKTLRGAAASDAGRAGGIGWRTWDSTGRAAATAVFGTEKAAVVGTVLAAIPGAVMAVVSSLLGFSQGLYGTVVKASWHGLVEGARRFLPALQRLLNFVGRVLRNILPFAFGFIWGGIVGVFKTGGAVAISFFKPVVEAFGAEDDGRTRPSEAQIGFGLLLGLTLLPLAAAVFAGGFVMGAVLGLPVVLTFAVMRGIKWAKPSDASVAYARAWERTAADRAAGRMIHSVSGVFAGVGREMPIWRLYVRVASALLGAPVTALTLLVSGYQGYFKSFGEAKAAAAGQQLPAMPEEPKAPASSETEAPETVPAGKAPVAFAAAAGIAGLIGGLGAMWFFGLPFLAGLSGWALWAGYAGVFAGLPLGGLSLGLALTQPVTWKNLLPLVKAHGAGGFKRSYEYWTNSGDAALQGIFGLRRGTPLTFLHRFVGAAAGLAWSVAGAVYGLGAALAAGAYAGARQVVYEILPALRVAFETAMKVLRRVVPFVLGLLAGIVGGVIGSAAFGALLLGRPYFSHVVGEDFETSGAIAYLGKLFMKLVALVLGVLFGLGGIVAGVIVAAPYSVTSAVALAFRWADIGGPVQRFFDHWSFGSLREEMRRINQLTSKFKFEDAPEGRDPSLAAGWIRMANIFPATFAALFASIIAGYVGFVRSLGTAYRTSTSGQPVPEPTVDEESRREWDRTWSRAGRTAAGFWWWGIIGAAIGGGIVLASSWAPLGLAGWLLVGAAAAAGVVLAVTVGLIIAAIALMVWIGGQLR